MSPGRSTAASTTSATRRSRRSTARTSRSCRSPGPTTRTTPSRPPRCRATRSSSTACSTSTTPTLKVVAVNAATGTEIWKFDPSGGAPPGARFRHRGVTVHKDRVFVSYRSFLWALDKKTGTPIASFGTAGRIDLREGLGHARREAQRQRQHAGRRLRGPADHGQLGAGDDARIARAHPRVRREHRQAALDLPHHSAARRVRLRHLVEGRLQAVRRRERVGRRHGRREARDGVRRHRIGVVRLLRRHAARRQPVRRLRARARRAHRQARLALPGHQARRLGLRLSRLAEPRHRHAQRPQGGRRRADHQVRLRLRPGPADRRAAVSDRVAQGAAVGRRRRAAVRAPAVSGEAAAVHAAGSHRGHADDADAGGARGGAGAVPQVFERASSRRRRSRARSSFPASTAAPNGAARRSIPTRRCSTSTRTRCRGSSS